MLAHARRGVLVCVLLAFAGATGTFATAGQERGAARAKDSSGAANSELSIVAAKVQMLLIAPDGKETGYDPRTKKTSRAIPDSTYDEDALLAYDSGRVDPNTTQTIDVRNPPVGKYRLIVSLGTAADGEEYEIQIHIYRNSGEARTARIAGTAQRRKIATYELRVSAGPAAVAIIDPRPQR